MKEKKKKSEAKGKDTKNKKTNTKNATKAITVIHKAYFKLFFTKADSRLKTIENNTAAIISTGASSLTENALA